MTHPMIDQLVQVANYPDKFEEAFWEWVLERVDDGEDIDRFFITDLFCKQIDARRKQMNTRLSAVVKAWKERKDELKPQILAVIDKSEDKKAWHALDGMGSVSVVKAKQKRAKMVDEVQAMDWLLEHHVPHPAMDDLVEKVVQLTDKGKTYLLDQALAREVQGYSPIPGVEVTLPARTIAVKPKRRATNEVIMNLVETTIFGDHTDHVLLPDQSMPRVFDESMEVFRDDDEND